MRIVIISNNDWDGLWYQRQQFATMFAEKGHNVLFINKTLQRTPKLKDFKDRFFSKNNVAIHTNPIPQNIEVLNIYTFPPTHIFRSLNRILIKRKLPSDFYGCDLLITYIPTYTAQDIIRILKPLKTAYINVHNYDAADVVKDLLISEKEIINNIDYLFADSIYNKSRLIKYRHNKQVYFSEPGVNTHRYLYSYRGDESIVAKSLCYFGGIGPHLDLTLFNALAEKYSVTFIGRVSDKKTEAMISHKINVIPPVSVDALPTVLREYDILCILYKKSNYIDGVIPAKFYECLATRKPIIVSNLGNLDAFSDVVYEYTPETNFELLMQEISVENPIVGNKRWEIALSADWRTRFNKLCQNLEINV